MLTTCSICEWPTMQEREELLASQKQRSLEQAQAEKELMKDLLLKQEKPEDLDDELTNVAAPEALGSYTLCIKFVKKGESVLE